MHLEDYLRQNATRNGEKIALICKGKTLTYRELLAAVEAKSKEISSKQRPIPFRASQDIDTIVTYLAIHQSGNIALPLAKDTPERLYAEIEKELEVCNFTSEIADILYTTGTTGHPKGVLISHRAIIADAENLIEAQHYTSDLTFIISGPLNHIGSLSKIFPVIVVGATLYITEGMKDVNAFYEALEHPCPKIATFLVPASIRILLKLSAERLQEYGDKIDFIETGAAPISLDDMRELCRLLPHTRLYNTYASTESGIIATYNFNIEGCVEGCVGKAMKHSSVEINSDGLIVCRGATLMSGYVTDSSVDSIAKRTLASSDNSSSDGSEKALITNDLGHIDEKGLLHLHGRNDDIINIGGYKIDPTEIENATLEIPGISDCICIAAPHPISGTALKLLIVKETGAQTDARSIVANLKQKLEPHKIPLLIDFVPSIARTFNGKLDRKSYFSFAKSSPNPSNVLP